MKYVIILMLMILLNYGPLMTMCHSFLAVISCLDDFECEVWRNIILTVCAFVKKIEASFQSDMTDRVFIRIYGHEAHST